MIKNAFAIPQELRDLKQWILWRYEDKGAKKPTKVPYSINGHPASVDDFKTWSNFDEAFNAFQLGGYDGIGFVFTDNDPYSFIDLDDCEGNQADLDRQIKIHQEFDSYSEISPSGKGLHIIVKGRLPQGRRRAHIEVYSSLRYATMTGNVYNNKPIAEKHELLLMLFEQMGSPPKTHSSYTGNEPEKVIDQEIFAQASSAVNGEKFTKLYAGEWSLYYPSQSEADFALIDIIAFYTQNRNQITRMFRASGLGQRDKAKRTDYINYMIEKSFDRMLPQVDIEGFKIALDEKIALQQQKDQLDLTLAGSPSGKASGFGPDIGGSNPSPAANDGGIAQRSEPIAHNGLVAGSNPAAPTITPPPGLMGEIAQFIYNAAPRPVPEIALAAAIGLMAGICGRAYNISGTGLNQYVLCIAMTGAGKEAMASGIDRLVNAVQSSVPVASEFIGPSRIASGQALYKYMATKSQCFVSIIGEFGLRMESMSKENANSAEKLLKAELLDLYNKSGHGQVARPSIYADSDKNTLSIPAPAFSILGESTPETFYRVVNEDMINEGLLPRFMLIEYRGGRPELNPNHLNAAPPMFLIDKVAQLMANTKTIMAGNRVINVQCEPDAHKMLNDFNKYADAKINNADREAIRQLWNRAHIKALKISALVAVGVNYYNPVVTAEYVSWAINMVDHDIRMLSAKFESGEIGKASEETKQFIDMKRVLKQYVTEPWSKAKVYGTDERLFNAKIVPYGYISKRLCNMASYRTDRSGATTAIKRSLQIMLDSDFLREIPRKELSDKYGTTQKSFVISNMSILDDDL